MAENAPKRQKLEISCVTFDPSIVHDPRLFFKFVVDCMTLLKHTCSTLRVTTNGSEESFVSTSRVAAWLQRTVRSARYEFGDAGAYCDAITACQASSRPQSATRDIEMCVEMVEDWRKTYPHHTHSFARMRLYGCRIPAIKCCLQCGCIKKGPWENEPEKDVSEIERSIREFYQMLQLTDNDRCPCGRGTYGNCHKTSIANASAQ